MEIRCTINSANSSGVVKLNCAVDEWDREVTHTHIIEFENDQKIQSKVCSIHAFLIRTSQVQYNSVEDTK